MTRLRMKGPRESFQTEGLSLPHGLLQVEAPKGLAKARRDKAPSKVGGLNRLV